MHSGVSWPQESKVMHIEVPWPRDSGVMHSGVFLPRDPEVMHSGVSWSRSYMIISHITATPCTMKAVLLISDYILTHSTLLDLQRVITLKNNTNYQQQQTIYCHVACCHVGCCHDSCGMLSCGMLSCGTSLVTL